MKTPKISETEWEIMKILWESAPMTSAEVIAALRSRDRSWHPKTAKTLLNRLVRKGALGFIREGRGYLYRPIAAREACVEAESASFLDRMFGGSLQPMVAHFVEHKKLSTKEINELKKILDQEK